MATHTVSHDLAGSDFLGTSRSFTTRAGYRRAWPTCRGCGSSLYGRLKRVAQHTIGGVPHEVDVYACPCGRRRRVTREVAAS